MAKIIVLFWFSNCQIFLAVFKKKISRFLYFFLGVAKNVKKFLKYIQIWLNYIMDDRQFSYITKMKKRP
jgi:hypothetical protein